MNAFLLFPLLLSLVGSQYATHTTTIFTQGRVKVIRVEGGVKHEWGNASFPYEVVSIPVVKSKASCIVYVSEGKTYSDGSTSWSKFEDVHGDGLLESKKGVEYSPPIPDVDTYWAHEIKYTVRCVVPLGKKGKQDGGSRR